MMLLKGLIMFIDKNKSANGNFKLVHCCTILDFSFRI